MTDGQRTPARAKPNIVKRQAQELLELSTPVVELWAGIILLPLIGTQVERDIMDEKRRDGIAAARQGHRSTTAGQRQAADRGTDTEGSASRCLRSLAD